MLRWLLSRGFQRLAAFDTVERVTEGVKPSREIGVENFIMDACCGMRELQRETGDSVLVTMERFAQNDRD